MNMELPNLPWKKVATDLFFWKASTYLLIIDYYSKYIKISNLNGQSSKIISHKINLCYRHGYFKKLHPTIDSHIHPVYTSNLQPNMVSPTQQVAYTIFKAERATPLHNGFLSSELLINRQLHMTWSILENQLQPSISE